MGKEKLKLYQERARLAIPYLVLFAKARKTVYYSELADLLKMPNARNLNYVLGEVGDLLLELNKNIPKIQSLVINKETRLPGTGLSFFVEGYDQKSLYEKRIIFEIERENVFDYKEWDNILSVLKLKPVSISISHELSEIKGSPCYGKGGESDNHKQMKEILSKHPNILELDFETELIKTEYILPSADAVDIMFKYGNAKIGVEVKSYISDEKDILRGLFQCVKYKHLIEAEQKVNNEYCNSRVILALEKELPIKYIIVKDLLGIEVIDKLRENKNYKKLLSKK